MITFTVALPLARILRMVLLMNWLDIATCLVSTKKTWLINDMLGLPSLSIVESAAGKTPWKAGNSFSGIISANFISGI
jgi:hypothetical protein